MPAASPALTLHQFVPGYAGKGIFDPLELSLHAGEMVALLGANGSGKSTLLRTIAGLQPAVAGTITLGAEQKKTDASQIAVVLTDPVKGPNMTVHELITYGRYPYLNWNIQLQPRDRKIIDESIARVNLGELVNSRIDELSDGQLQMVMIARALAQDTPVLLLDEPTSHLDLNNRVGILRFLRSLAHTSHKAVLVATHELDLALQTADRLWLAAGKRIKQGIPEDLVLNGDLERLFPVNGYHLPTGKILPSLHRNLTVRLSGGSDDARRWTQHALERNGIAVTGTGNFKIEINSSAPWSWQHAGRIFSTLAELLHVVLAAGEHPEGRI